MKTFHTDIAVIGGGAAGLAAAIYAARESKCGITVIERNPRPGKKLISTGNGRCNLAHSPVDFNAFYGERQLARSVFARTTPEDEFFSSLGVKLTCDKNGNVYPYSNTSSAVLDGLRLEVAKAGVNMLTEFKVIDIVPLMEGFRIYPDDDTKPIICARRLILAPGGKAAPDTGSDGLCFTLIKKLSIEVKKLSPALCPIKTTNTDTRAMKGLRINACCSAVLNNGKVLRSETGELQFGEDRLSGICIFNLASLASRHGSNLIISVDLAPDIPPDELLKFIVQTAKIRADLPIEDLLSGLLPKRCGVTITKPITRHPMNAKIKNLTTDELESLVLAIKDWRFPVRYSEPWLNAQVTAGGVPAHELTAELCSKRHPHLYFAGEVIDINGDCGGYNLMWCWRSGELAGKSAAGSLMSVDN
ncbi:MAG: aminoacetone oxidase family FAD-binding enzyme [Oscillospiraceae bacterium]|nr:aminoacetone oxidase family FAD-binding enzyme [Oscillospiraceae bacterium]